MKKSKKETTNAKPEQIGDLHPKDAMFFRVHVGEAKSGKLKYELSTNVGGSIPLVRSEKTGAWFALTWPQIINLAVAAGIDDPARVPAKKRRAA